MTKARRSNKEAKKKPILTMKEKKAARKSKKDGNGFLGTEKALHKPTPASRG